MTGRSKSDTKKKQIARQVKDGLMARAVAAYHFELGRPPNERRKGLRKVCRETEAEHYRKTKEVIKLDPMTLRRLASGGKRKSQSNAEKGWLKADEIDLVIDFAVETAARGFPLSHQWLREHVNAILHARLGSRFPPGGVGRRWTDRFVERHSARLSMYWAKPLDNAQGRAVNPATNDAWFNILGATLHGENNENSNSAEVEPILEENTYGVDESGFQGAGGTTERVIGGKGKKVQHQQGDGNWDNTAVIVTICADGTSLPPAVIFKGQSYQVKWHQNNPANAS